MSHFSLAKRCRKPLPAPRSTQPTSTLLLLTVILWGAFVLRTIYLTKDRFHADEALYAGWALRILDGDPLLLDVPVDKPPLYLHTLAASMRVFGSSEVAARLPNLAASMLGIALVYHIGRRLYDRQTGTWAALFVALSPFDILFARTAFTDPMLVMWTLGALCAAIEGRWLWTGICLGLAFATKQHAVALIPLVVTLGLARLFLTVEAQKRGTTHRCGESPSATQRSHKATQRSHKATQRSHKATQRSHKATQRSHKATQRSHRRSLSRHKHLMGRRCSAERGRSAVAGLLVGLLGFSIPFALVTWWDSARWAIRPGYWEQSTMSYGGLTWAAFNEWGGRFVEWLGWARYLTGSLALNLLLIVGCATLLVRGCGTSTAPVGRRRSKDQSTWFDTIFVVYTVGYLISHTVSQFSTWDRYLLPLAPLVGLLLARIVTCGKDWLESALRERKIFPRAAEGARQSVEGARQSGTFRLLFLRVPSIAVFVVCLVALFSGWQAAHNGYPVGGEHWAYQGLDQVTAYLKQNAPPDAVLYHHWLRWHYTYYLYGTDFELRWWQSGEHLRREAMRTPQRVQYIVLPDWRTLEPDVEGIRLEPVYEARRQDGSVSLRVYRIKLEL